MLREAVAAGVNHIDTSDFYGPYVVNEIIREALHPYPRDSHHRHQSWRPSRGRCVVAAGAKSGRAYAAVHDNLRHLRVEAMDVVNLRIPGAASTAWAVSDNSIAEQFGALAKLREQGLIRHLGVSNASSAQIAEARGIAEVVCVQNFYNLAHREDDAMVDDLAVQGIACVPFFPLGGFTPLQSDTLSAVAKDIGATPMQVALAWLLQRSPNILLIPGTSSREHLRENLAAAELKLTDDAVARLNAL